MSKTAIAVSVGQTERGARTGLRVTSNAAATANVAAARSTSVAQYGSLFAAWSRLISDPPNVTAAMSPKMAPEATRRPVSESCSRPVSTTPTSARPMPMPCRALGRSPRARPTVTGISGAVAEIGATTPIRPTVSPR